MKLNSYINDFSGVLDEKKITAFNKMFFHYQEESGVEITTVFIKHRNGRQLKDIALEIFNENGIGDKETNSGLLLVVVTDEKKIRIMTGKGMEIEFSDSYCRDIIEGELRGLMNSGNYIELIQSWYELSTKLREINKKLLIKTGKLKTTINYSKKRKSRKNKVLTLVIMYCSIILTLGFGIFEKNVIIFFIFAPIILLSIFFSFLDDEKEMMIHLSTVFVLLGIPFFLLAMYLTTTGELVSSGSSSSSSSYESSSDSSYDYDDSSDYDSNWGGGSSNGGGYGD